MNPNHPSTNRPPMAGIQNVHSDSHAVNCDMPENTLIVSREAFTEMISGLIKSGVKFKSRENATGDIKVIFTGGY